jgi:hypothetical protein
VALRDGAHNVLVQQVTEVEQRYDVDYDVGTMQGVHRGEVSVCHHGMM